MADHAVAERSGIEKRQPSRAHSVVAIADEAVADDRRSPRRRT
ncbi:hypothetical protein Pd630_LPD03842 [Rhodococcus opacus PD630]|nr:hypothetical protein Pd630_LPD03842 [Rhodococcus opacus PD630]